MLAISGIFDPSRRQKAWREYIHRMPERFTYGGRHRDEVFDFGPLVVGAREFGAFDGAVPLRPIANEDETVQLFCNGQIHTSPSVRRDLETLGHRFSTRDPAESILHAYERYGLDAFSYFEGMFAFLLWDSKRGRLLIARDRFGVKPIFHTVPADDGSFAFSTQLAPLLRLPGLSRDLDSVAVHQFFSFSYVLHPRTVYQQIRKISPANALQAQGNAVHIAPYWEMPIGQKPMGLAEGRAALDDAISEAVKRRMPETGELCTFLSGGNDSSTVAYHMKRNANRPIHTFSARFDSKDGYDEGPMAKITADHLGTRHHEVWVTPDDVKLLPELMANYGEPFADPSAIPTFLVSKHISMESSVSLCGDGADEMLGGYELYAAAQLANLTRIFPDRMRRWTLSALNRMPIHVTAGGLDVKLRNSRRFFSACHLTPAEQHEIWKVYLTEEQKSEFYTPKFRATMDPTAAFPLLSQWRSLFDAASTNWLTPIQYLDIKTYLVDNNMAKVECSGSANGLEIRVPYLDLDVFQTAFRLPTKARTHWGRRKIMAKELMKGRLPEVILKGQKKGFGVPLAPWFVGPLQSYAEEMLRPERIARTGIVQAHVGEQLLAIHKGRRLNVSRKIWNLICFLAWFENNEGVGFH